MNTDRWLLKFLKIVFAFKIFHIIWDQVLKRNHLWINGQRSAKQSKSCLVSLVGPGQTSNIYMYTLAGCMLKIKMSPLQLLDF